VAVSFIGGGNRRKPPFIFATVKKAKQEIIFYISTDKINIKILVEFMQ
jgi:hypothetical protein